jgi:hypothetical protein
LRIIQRGRNLNAFKIILSSCIFQQMMGWRVGTLWKGSALQHSGQVLRKTLHAGGRWDPVTAAEDCLGPAWRPWIAALWRALRSASPLACSTILLLAACSLNVTAWHRVSGQSVPPPSSQTGSAHRGFVGDAACGECHQGRSDSYLSTAHHRTSRLATSDAIAGRFTAGENRLRTFNPQLSFVMEARNGQYFETAVRNRPGHPTKQTEPINLVIGSATKGQTYLYWKGSALYELPVSYWTELRRWVNSPGYVDGSADFERPVTPRCLECHATYFEQISVAPSDNHFSRNNFILGISCERCHGPGLLHIQRHLGNPRTSKQNDPLPPIGLARERQIDICAQCHGGVGRSLAPAFSFRPGETLSSYVALEQLGALKEVDVHGNQVALLKRSRCFQSSPGLTCSTCHDVHSRERPAASYSAQCLSCHEQKQCGAYAKLGPTISGNCVDCHMPVQQSNLLVLDTDEGRLKAKVRNHWIRVYPNSH